MAEDARLSTGLAAHPKTRRLRKRIGPAGCWSLIVLILWTASERHDGRLAGLSDEDIELAAEWEGDDGAFVAALLETSFLEGDAGDRAIHDWAEHQPFVAKRPERIAKAKYAAEARWGARKAAPGGDGSPPPVREARQEDASSMQGACAEHKRAMPPPSLPPHQTDSAPSERALDVPPSAEPDPIFGTGLAFLKKKGIPERNARSFLGLLRKQVGDLTASELLTRAEKDDVSDPLAWLRKAADTRQQAKPARPSVTARFTDTSYEGTPDDELPEYLRTDAA